MWYWCQPLQASTHWLGEVWSRKPRKTSSVPFLEGLLVLFGYPARSGAALLEGHLPSRYCATRFACKVPTWRLPVGGVSLAFLLRTVKGLLLCVLLLVLLVLAAFVFRLVV